MEFINEVQGPSDFNQDIPLENLRTLVDIGVLVHVQTSVYGDKAHRYFVPASEAHPYVVVNNSHTADVFPNGADEHYVGPRHT